MEENQNEISKTERTWNGMKIIFNGAQICDKVFGIVAIYGTVCFE